MDSTATSSAQREMSSEPFNKHAHMNDAETDRPATISAPRQAFPWEKPEFSKPGRSPRLSGHSLQVRAHRAAFAPRRRSPCHKSAFRCGPERREPCLKVLVRPYESAAADEGFALAMRSSILEMREEYSMSVNPASAARSTIGASLQSASSR